MDVGAAIILLLIIFFLSVHTGYVIATGQFQACWRWFFSAGRIGPDFLVVWRWL